MVEVDFYGNAPSEIGASMQNFCVNWMRDRQTITMLSIGSGSFQYGWNFQVFTSFTPVGTSLLVPI
jgi:hypothetical protein